jgi:hypothetical protein
MGVLIKSTDLKKIHIKGTEIELSMVYIRIEFNAKANGSDIEIRFKCFQNKNTYKDNNRLPTDLPLNTYYAKIDTEIKTQNIDVVHEIVKDYFESIGYECIIDL